METKKLVDLVLDELVNTRQPSISVRRVFKKHRISYDDSLIKSVEVILKSKSLVSEMDKDSAGYTCYSLSITGQDFLKTFGSYSKFLRGIDSETKKIERARKKKPFNPHRSVDGKPPLPFMPEDESYLVKNRVGIAILVVVLILFYIVSRITESLV
jgi:hypothetical protein